MQSSKKPALGASTNRRGNPAEITPETSRFDPHRSSALLRSTHTARGLHFLFDLILRDRRQVQGIEPGQPFGEPLSSGVTGFWIYPVVTLSVRIQRASLSGNTRDHSSVGLGFYATVT
ncbi:MAG: hypothetical protein ACREWG_14580 [Gammaproteobacteria bacterium]